MAQVSADLVLNIDEALAAIEALGDLISDVTSNVVVDVGVDTSEAEAGIDSLAAETVEVPVDADVDPAQAEIDSLEGDEVTVPVGADISDAEAEIASIEGETVEVDVQVNGGEQVEQLGDSLNTASGGAESFAGALGGASIAARGLVGVGIAGFLTASIGAFAEADGVVAVTTNTIENMGTATGVTIEGVQALADNLLNTAGVSDEATLAAAGLIARFGELNNAAGEGNDIFNRTLILGADLAAVLGTDITSAANLLGRALADPEAGLGRLQRAIGPLDDAIEANILNLAEQGDLLGAQRLLLDAVEESVGGAADAFGGSFAGQLRIAGEQLGEFLESAGEVAVQALPVLTGALRVLGPFLENFADGLETIGQGISAIPTPILAAAAAFGALYLAAAYFFRAITALAATNPIVPIAIALGTLVTAIGAAGDAALAGIEAFDNMAEATQSLGETLATAGEEALVAEVLQRMIDISPGFVSALTEAGSSVAEFVQAALDGPAAFQAYGDSLGLNTDLTNEQQLAMLALTEQLFGAQGAADDFTAAEEANAAALGLTTEEAAAAEQAIQQLADAFTSNAPEMSAAISEVEDNLNEFGETIDSATDARLVLDNLDQSIEAFRNFAANLETIGQTSTEVRDVLAVINPEIAGGLAQALADGNPALIRQFRDRIREIERFGGDAVELFGGQATDSADAWEDGLRPLPEVTRSLTQRSIRAVEAQRNSARNAGRDVGDNMTTGVERGVDGMSPAARRGVNDASDAARAARNTAASGGRSVGNALVEGMAEGIASSIPAVTSAARAAVAAAVQAAQNEAGISSPSKVFMEMGLQMGEGMAIGLGDSAAVVAAAEALTAAAAYGASSTVYDSTVQVSVDARGASDPQAVGDAVAGAVEASLFRASVVGARRRRG